MCGAGSENGTLNQCASSQVALLNKTLSGTLYALSCFLCPHSIVATGGATTKVTLFAELRFQSWFLLDCIIGNAACSTVLQLAVSLLIDMLSSL